MQNLIKFFIAGKLMIPSLLLGTAQISHLDVGIFEFELQLLRVSASSRPSLLTSDTIYETPNSRLLASSAIGHTVLDITCESNGESYVLDLSGAVPWRANSHVYQPLLPLTNFLANESSPGATVIRSNFGAIRESWEREVALLDISNGRVRHPTQVDPSIIRTMMRDKFAFAAADFEMFPVVMGHLQKKNMTAAQFLMSGGWTELRLPLPPLLSEVRGRLRLWREEMRAKYAAGLKLPDDNLIHVFAWEGTAREEAL